MTDWPRPLVYLLLICFTLPLTAQENGIPLNSKTYHLVDRLEIISGQRAPLHTAIQYYNRKDVTQFALELDTAQLFLSEKDRQDLRYIFRDNNEWLNPAEGPTSLISKKQPVFNQDTTD